MAYVVHRSTTSIRAKKDFWGFHFVTLKYDDVIIQIGISHLFVPVQTITGNGVNHIATYTLLGEKASRQLYVIFFLYFLCWPLKREHEKFTKFETKKINIARKAL